MDSASRYKRDMIGAALMVVLGAVVVWVGTDYKMGTLTRMGAGYVPVVLGVLFIIVGALIAATNRRDGPAAGGVIPVLEVPVHGGPRRFEYRGWGCILGGVAAFVVLGHYGGLVPATFMAVLISAMGDRDNSVRDALLLAAGVTVAGVIIFSYGLKLVFPLFTWG